MLLILCNVPTQTNISALFILLLVYLVQYNQETNINIYLLITFIYFYLPIPLKKMEICTDLEVDVNGEQVFFLDKKIITTYSGRLRKLFGKILGTKKRLKVIFSDFPASAECFELIARFCYNNGRVKITPANIFLLYSTASFMEMNEDINGITNLVKQTETYLKRGIHCWTWSEVIAALKQCQVLFIVLESSFVFQEFLNFVVQRLTLPLFSSPCSSSSGNSSFQFSGDISIETKDNYNPQTPFWFDDLVFLNIDLFEKVVKAMVSQKLDNFTICNFIFYYQKSRFVASSRTDKRRIEESVINLLCLLDTNAIACKGLFYTFRVAMGLKIGKSCKGKFVSLIGSQLDQAKIDDLLVRGKNCAYDVNLILRLLKVFVNHIYTSSSLSLYKLKKVGGLIDLYMAEVGPDPRLKFSKFLALASALPDIARDSQDKMFQAIHMYLKVHRNLCEEEKKRLYSRVNLEKLSYAILKHKGENSKALNTSTLGNGLYKEEENIDCSAEKKKLRTDMRWRVVELDRVSEKLRTKILKATEIRASNPSNVRSLPRLCRDDRNFNLLFDLSS